MTNMHDIRKLQDAELTALVAEKREALRSFRFGTGGQNTGAPRAAHKEVARLLTELTARRRAANDESN